MGYFKDVREHIAALEKAGMLVRIDREINKDTELHPLVRLQFRGLPEDQRRAFLFTRITDVHGHRYSIPIVVCCLAGSRRIYAMGLQCDPARIAERWTEARKNTIEPVLVSGGPVHEEVHAGAELDRPGLGLEEFPIPISTPGFDAAPFTSASHWITKDPETGIRNIGNYRGMVKSRTRLGMNAGGTQHISQHWRKWQKIGKPMPVAVVIGAPPHVSYTSVVKIPYGVDEYAVAGGLAGEPVPIVKCKTVDIEVPADAEIVIEGTINTELMEPEAPFGEFTGYMDPQQLNPFMDITCVTHRKNPIFVAMLSQFPPSESSKIRGIGSEGNAMSYLKGLGFECVTDVAYIESSGSWGMCCVQVKNPKSGEPRAILEACAKSPLIGRGKMVILVDDDIDPRDTEALVWAMSYRMQPRRDMQIIPTKLLSADWSAFPPGTGNPGGVQAGENPEMDTSLLLIDATRKWPYPPVSLPSREVMEHALQIWQQLELPSLALRKPWYGYDLGWWSDVEREAGALAIQGRYYETGEKVKRARVAVRGDDSEAE
jgi:4-hydroxy-3-polyprenylbenzoate decarboxylase